MNRTGTLIISLSLSSAAMTAGAADPVQDTPPVFALPARCIAIGLHGAHGIRQVGRFHSGGPFTANPEFLLRTQAGHVLDPERLLVTVDSNLGATPADAAQAPGAILSIDPRAADDTHPLVVRPDAALRPPTTGAPVQVFSAQGARYLNRLHNEGARTAAFAATSSPRYLSINNAFGRPWVANAPFGTRGDGSESVVDPDGAPLANAPSDAAGGVFVGASTARTSAPKAVRVGGSASFLNRRDSPQLTPGAIDRGAMGTALLGASPDGSGLAVFAVVTGSGAVVQVHVQDGVDGLAPPGTVDVGTQDPGLIGIAFKWGRDRALYIADARRDRIVVLDLADDTLHFKLERTGQLASRWLHQPVDLAPAIPEIANPRFSSHTTLASGADLYVVNRGDGSVLRMRQDGTVVARATVEIDGVPVGAGRLRSIAVSADAQRLWLIAQARGSDEAMLIQLSAFDAAGPFAAPAPYATSATSATALRSADRVRDGARLFVTDFTPRMGLGPMFNAASCVACHPGPGGASSDEAHFARRIARMEPESGRLVVIAGQGAQIAPRHSTREFGEMGAPSADLPRGANVVSMRMPLSLAAVAPIDDIPDAVIEAQAVAKGDGIKGRVHYVATASGARRVGRYGWKGDIGSLDDMVAEALHNEMGITSALSVHPTPLPKDDGDLVRALTAYVRSLRSNAVAAPTAQRP